MKELVEQLERAMWRHLDKTVPTQVLTGDSRPARFDGVTVRDRRLRARRGRGRLPPRADHGRRDPPCRRDRHVPASPRHVRRTPGSSASPPPLARRQVRHHRPLRRAQLQHGHRRGHGRRATSPRSTTGCSSTTSTGTSWRRQRTRLLAQGSQQRACSCRSETRRSSTSSRSAWRRNRGPSRHRVLPDHRACRAHGRAAGRLPIQPGAGRLPCTAALHQAAAAGPAQRVPARPRALCSPRRRLQRGRGRPGRQPHRLPPGNAQPAHLRPATRPRAAPARGQRACSSWTSSPTSAVSPPLCSCGDHSLGDGQAETLMLPCRGGHRIEFSDATAGRSSIRGSATPPAWRQRPTRSGCNSPTCHRV